MRVQPYISFPEKTRKERDRKYFRWNNKLSGFYKKAKTPEQKNKIISLLYKLDLPLFRTWNIWNPEDKKDFEQDIFFFLQKALNCYDSKRGNFLYFLKAFFIKKAWAKASKQYKKKQDLLELFDIPGDFPPQIDIDWLPEPVNDHILWKSIRKICLSDEWAIIKGICFEGKTTKTLAQELNTNETLILQIKKGAFLKIKTRVL